MKIICAGFPKTASKSCSNALRQLGYKVADMRETVIDLSEEWVKFMLGTGSIEAVIREYHSKGYDVNQVRVALSYNLRIKFFIVRVLAKIKIYQSRN